MRKFFFFLFIFILFPVVSNTNHYKNPEKYRKYDGQSKKVVIYKERTIKQNYCTKTFKLIKVLEGDEKKYEIFDYHETDDTNKREINLKEIGDVVKGLTVNEILVDLYCLPLGDRISVLRENELKGKYQIDDAFLDSEDSILKIPDGIFLRISDLELKNVFIKAEQSIEDTEAKSQTEIVETEPKEIFDEEKQEELLQAAKDKLQDFDAKIGEIKTYWNDIHGKLIQLESDYKIIKNSVENTLDVTFNKNIPEIREKYISLKESNKNELSKQKIEEIKGSLNIQKNKIFGNPDKDIKGLEELRAYTDIIYLKSKFENAKVNENLKSEKTGKFYSVDFINDMKSINTEKIKENIERAENAITIFDKKIQDIDVLRQEIEDLDTGANKKDPYDKIIEYLVYVVIFLFVVAVSTFIYLQSRKIKKLSKMSQSAETKFSDMEDKLKTTSEKINLARTATRSRSSLPPEQPPEEPKTVVQIRTEKFEDLKRDYQEALDNFSKVAGFKQKWRGLALSRKERQETAKTVLINSSRPFEKSEIWCLSFEEKHIAYPGSSVKTNMSIYMNFDFQKAQFDFKGIFNITSGSSYSVKPCTLRRGGAGFVVEHAGEIQFPK